MFEGIIKNTTASWGCESWWIKFEVVLYLAYGRWCDWHKENNTKKNLARRAGHEMTLGTRPLVKKLSN
jgi:hypothetical protein